MHLRLSLLRKGTGILFVILATIASAQTASRISPTAGSSTGGGRLDVIGTGLTTSTVVTVGGNRANVISALADGSRLTATVPAGTVGTANVVVGSVTLSGAYSYLNPATIAFA